MACNAFVDVLNLHEFAPFFVLRGQNNLGEMYEAKGQINKNKQCPSTEKITLFLVKLY